MVFLSELLSFLLESKTATLLVGGKKKKKKRKIVEVSYIKCSGES